MRRLTVFQATSLLTATFYLAACGTSDNRTEADKQADATSMAVLSSFATKGVAMSSLDASQQAFMNSLLPAYAKLSAEDQVYVATFEKAKLTPKGVTLQQFLSNPAAAGTDFTNDASFLRIKAAARAQIGLPPATAALSSADDPARQGLTVAIDCLTVVIIVGFIGIVVIAVTSINGTTAIEFCDNCSKAAIMACGMKMKEAKMRCTADGKIMGSANFDSKDGTVSKADGTSSQGYTCEWQCL
jgi:hypothetical protein